MKSNYFKKITYTDKTQTPLLWHDYNRFFRIPCSILACLAKLSTASVNDADIFYISEIALLISLLFFEFNQTKWNDNAYFGIITSIIVSFFNSFARCTYYSLPGARIFGAIIVCILEFIYYYKRRKLFDGISMKEAKELKYNSITNEADHYNEKEMLLENKKNAYIGLRNRLRELNAPGLREIENKISEHIKLSEYEIKVYQIRLKMNELYDSIKDDSPFGKTYTEADEMIKKLEER